MGEVSTRVTALRFEDQLWVLDQRALPGEERWLEVCSAVEAVEAIRSLAVRGAPLLGLVAAYALAVEARANPSLPHLHACAQLLATARPTAVNLSRGVADIMAVAESTPEAERAEALLAKARALHAEDAASCLAMARLGASCLPGKRVALLTHCNTGALATGGVGTALGVVRALAAEGRLAMLFACEARPVLQGARLTTWEARRDGLPVTLLPDGAAGALLASGRAQAVVVGADRIAADGSVANKVGTYPLAVLARRHQVPFLVVAPTSTFDLDCAGGATIPIEQRSAEEVTWVAGRRLAAEGVEVFNPAFDVTPPELLTAIVCERGVVSPVTPDRLRAICP